MHTEQLAEIATRLQAEADVATTHAEVQAVLEQALTAYAQVEQDVFHAEHEAFAGWQQARETWVGGMRTIFGEIPGLLTGMHGVLALLDAEDSRFRQAPAEVQERLRNRQKGLAIICRMADRLPPRQDALERLVTNEYQAPQPCPLASKPTLQRLEMHEETQTLAPEIADMLEQIAQAEKQTRDTNYHRTRTLRLEVEGLKQAVLSFLRDYLLPVIDGLERGLWDEDTLKQPLNGYHEDRELVDQWFGSYHACDQLMHNFLLKIGLTRAHATPGDVFNPNWHLALGHESCPTLSDGQICAVLRSGWRFCDVLVRPAEVLVVRNEARQEEAEKAPKGEG